MLLQAQKRIDKTILESRTLQQHETIALGILKDILYLQLHSLMYLETTGQERHSSIIKKNTKDCCAGRPPCNKYKRRPKADDAHNKN